MTQVIVIGLILGVATALSPRPVLFLLVGESARAGLRGGLATLLGSLVGDALLAAGLVVVTVLLQRSAPGPLAGAYLLAAFGLFYLTYHLGIGLPRVGTLVVADMPDRVDLGTWTGWSGLWHGLLACIGSSVSWAYWILVGTALVAALQHTPATLTSLVATWWCAIGATYLFVTGSTILGSLYLDKGVLRGVLIMGVSILWISGIYLLITGVRSASMLWVY